MRSRELENRLNALTNELIQVVTDALHRSGATTTTLLDRTEASTPDM